MTAKRKNHVFSLLFTILVCGAVYLAYQFRDGETDQTSPAQADVLLASQDDEPGFQANRTQASRTQADRAQVAQPLATASSSTGETASDERSPQEPFSDDGNLLVNGGFERPSLEESGFATPPGWASRERELEFWIDGHLGISSDEGQQHIELNGRVAGRITQDVEVVPGQAYRWSFSHRARNDQDTVKALIDGELVTDATSLPGQWRTASGLFVAADDQQVITFGIESVDGGEFGNFIDNVRFEVQAGL